MFIGVILINCFWIMVVMVGIDDDDMVFMCWRDINCFDVFGD